MSTKREQIIQLVKEYYREEFESKKKDFDFGVLTDPASAGVLAAIETAKRSDDCMIVSHGGEDVGIEMLKKDNCFQGTVCYDPAKYGEGLIPLAVRIIQGEQAEVYNYAQQYMLTRDNLG